MLKMNREPNWGLLEGTVQAAPAITGDKVLSQMNPKNSRLSPLSVNLKRYISRLREFLKQHIIIDSNFSIVTNNDRFIKLSVIF